MRTWFWMLVVFVGAVAVALVLRDHGGNVLILMQPWRIELSLTFAILLLIAAFLLLHALLRIVAWVGAAPGRLRSWKGARAQRRDHNLLESGWINILEGRYEQADKDLARLLGKTRSRTSKVVAALASARAAHRQGELQRRDTILDVARTNARDDARLNEAVAMVAAEMALDDHRPEDALVLLQPLQDASSRYLHATRLLMRAHQQLEQHDRVYELVRLLQRRGAINAHDALAVVAGATPPRLRHGGSDGFKAIWNDLKSDEKTVPAIALAAAEVQAAAGQADEASRILEAAIARNMTPELLAAYARCPADTVARRLAKAEVWNKEHPGDPSLLAALGALCISGKLWGQAERYLTESMRLRSDMQIHALLGNLYDALGRSQDAARHWRLAAEVAGQLPVVAIRRALPAADTRMDPGLHDAHGPDEDDDPNPFQVPVAASAADMADEPRGDTRDRGGPVAAISARTAVAPGSDDVEQYFDSAPIPGIAGSRTPHGPA